MKILGLFVINLFILSANATGQARMCQIRAHIKDRTVSLLQQPEAAPANAEKQDAENKNDTLNLIFSPTAKQVSEESNKLLEAVESGLHNLRNAYNILTRLIHLLPEEEKQAYFTVDKQSYTVMELIDSFNNLIIEGERQQRNLIQGTAEILHKLAMPNQKSQNATQS